MVLSNGLVIIFAAIGAVIFLFLMDYYYFTLERQANRAPLGDDETIDLPIEHSLLEATDQTDESNLAA